MRKLAPPRQPALPGGPATPAPAKLRLRLRAAAEAAAAHRTRLALSRWYSGDTPADLKRAAALHPGPQAQWHAALQRQFSAWLEAGGFAAPQRQAGEPADRQARQTAAPLKTAALRRCSQPHCGTIDEELKFSLLRIRDAVE
jgi:hypothetical protein